MAGWLGHAHETGRIDVIEIAPLRGPGEEIRPVVAFVGFANRGEFSGWIKTRAQRKRSQRGDGLTLLGQFHRPAGLQIAQRGTRDSGCVYGGHRWHYSAGKIKWRL